MGVFPYNVNWGKHKNLIIPQPLHLGIWNLAFEFGSYNFLIKAVIPLYHFRTENTHNIF